MHTLKLIASYHASEMSPIMMAATPEAAAPSPTMPLENNILTNRTSPVVSTEDALQILGIESRAMNANDGGAPTSYKTVIANMNEPLNFGIDSAYRVVKDILEQITLNDSPPINDQEVVPKKSPNSLTSATASLSTAASTLKQESPNSKRRYSRQQHVIPDGTVEAEESHSPVSSLGNASTLSSIPSLEESKKGTDTAALWMEQYNKSQTRAEMKMGNVALATLCIRTLDSIDASQVLPVQEQVLPADSLLASQSPMTVKECSMNVDNKSPGFKKKPQLSIVTDTGALSQKTRASPEQKSSQWHKRWKRMSPKMKKAPSPPGAIANEWTSFLDDDFPPTPVRSNRRPKSPEFQEPDQDATPRSKSGGRDATPHGGVAGGSFDSADAVYTRDVLEDDVPVSNENKPTESPEREDVDVSWSLENEDEEENEEAVSPDSNGFGPATSGDMEDIAEETEDDIAEEQGMHGNQSRRLDYNQELQTRTPMKTTQPPPTQVVSPRRFQMFGSEYARFLSTSPLAPTVAAVRAHGKRKSVMGMRSSVPREFRSSTGNTRTGKRALNIEDASVAALTGAITDIIVTHGTQMPPKGYYRISQTGEGDQFTALRKTSSHSGVSGLIPGRRTTQVFINVKKEPNWDRAAQRPCVTALAVIFPDRKEFVPPGFCVVRRYKSQVGDSSDNGEKPSSAANMAADLNFGSTGERVFLCYRRSREGNPITGIFPLQPLNHETIPEGYTVIERTPRNHVADINTNAGAPVFLAFRQRLASLEPLRPLPLVLSVHSANPFDNLEGSATGQGSFEKRMRPSSRKKRLSAYYCTGGTIVASEVGRFHIMDRTTHSLLSPSSITHRLSLIAASRQRSEHGMQLSRVPTYASSVLSDVSDLGMEDSGNEQKEATRSSVNATDLTLDETESSGESSLNRSGSHSNLSQSLSNLSIGSNHGDVDDHSFTSNMSTSVASTRYSSSAANVINQTLFSNNDAELQRCLEALDFIPTIETATRPNCLEDDPYMRKLQARVAALTPILTSCYTHHGGSALIAVEGLTKLLTTTDFFSPDVASLADPDSGASTRLTLLDLATQSVCDVATCTSRETSFGVCVDFVQHAVEYSQGQLSARTIGYVLRFYLFVFYFGASVPTSSKGANPVWTAGSREMKESSSERSVVALNDLPLLYEEPFCPASKARRYLPGGAPQASALALKGLITSLIFRLQQMSTGEAKAFADGIAEVTSSEPFGAAIEGIVMSLIDSAVYRVDLANYTQLALHQVHRSGGSELFWFDMLNSCGNGLFGMAGKLPTEMKAGYILSFAILANLVKVASGRIRHVPQTNEAVPRDVASKLLSLELVQHFIEQWERDQARLGLKESSIHISVVRAVETMAFSIRRLVVPCLLTNTEFAIEDGRVYRRVMQILSVLWCSRYYRRHMKMEIGVLVDQFALRILRLGPQIFAPGLMGVLEKKNSNESVSIGSLAAPNETKSELKTPLLSQQIDLLFEIKRWFDADMAAVEFFLNYDTNLWSHEVAMGQMIPGTHWRLCQQLCGAICTIAEQSGELLSQQIRASRISNTIPPPSPTAATASAFFSSEAPLDGSPEEADKTMREGSRHLQRASFEAVSQILKSLAHSSATAVGVEYQELVLGWEENDAEEPSADSDFSLSVVTDPSTANTMSSPSPRSNKNRSVRTPKQEDVQKQQKPEEKIVGYWQSAIAAERRRAAASPYRTAIDHAAVSSNSNVGGSQKHKGLSPLKLDEAASSTLPDADIHLPVAFEIARTKNLKKAVDYLIACDFLTPSPRDVSAFLRLHRGQLNPAALGVFLAEGGTGGGEIEYWNQIRFNYFRPISFVGMNVEQGLRHFLTNCGFRLPGEAQQIDRIMTTFSQVYWEDNAGDLQKCPFHDRDTVFLIAFAIIMLNTDLHKSTSSNSRKQRKRMTKSEFLNNLRGVDNNENISREYLSNVYDSIEANPISLHMTDGMSAHGSLSSSYQDESSEQLSLNLALTEALQNAKMSEELLRGVSVHEHPFYTMEDFGRHLGYESRHDALADVVRTVIATTWHHFHGLIHAVLDAAHLDPRGMEMSLDLLQYVLCTTICLDMTLERTAFMTQLARYKMFRERRGLRFSRDHQAYKSEGWYAKLEMNCADPSDDAAKLVALADVRELIQDLRDSLRIDVTAKREMNCVVRRIRQGEFLLNDPTRSFLREGDLVKRGSRMGRTTKYRFFLFSDVLIYAKASTDDFKIHEELPLHLMKVTDWFPDKRQQMKTAFRIHHPRKTFIVFAESVEDRQEWVKNIRSAIEKEVERLTYLENARLAAAAVER